VIILAWQRILRLPRRRRNFNHLLSRVDIRSFALNRVALGPAWAAESDPPVKLFNWALRMPGDPLDSCAHCLVSRCTGEVISKAMLSFSRFDVASRYDCEVLSRSTASRSFQNVKAKQSLPERRNKTPGSPVAGETWGSSDPARFARILRSWLYPHVSPIIGQSSQCPPYCLMYWVAADSSPGCAEAIDLAPASPLALGWSSREHVSPPALVLYFRRIRLSLDNLLYNEPGRLETAPNLERRKKKKIH